jgi:hypothetical protein
MRWKTWEMDKGLEAMATHIGREGIRGRRKVGIHQCSNTLWQIDTWGARRPVSVRSRSPSKSVPGSGGTVGQSVISSELKLRMTWTRKSLESTPGAGRRPQQRVSALRCEPGTRTGGGRWHSAMQDSPE